MARHQAAAVGAPGEHHHEAEAAVSSVRPYAVTGGRRAPSAAELPLEALVEALRAPWPGMVGEARAVLELTSGAYLSVAELSAHVRLPVPVVRVVLGDLLGEGAVRVHAPRPLTTTGGAVRPGPARGWEPASPLSLLETVLHGISAL